MRSRSIGLGALGALAVASTALAAVPPIDLPRPGTLPAPVARYLGHVLTDGQPAFSRGTFAQSGTLRTSPRAGRWMAFTAEEAMTAPVPGFAWDARVALMPLVHLQVKDGYADGAGAGAVKLFGLLPMGGDRGTPEMNSGALHRYLAEAVWFPVALLPREGLRWSAIDDHRALATLTDHGTTVALEFRFDAADEVVGVYTPGRWGSFDGGYAQVAWEGHFRDYFRQDGMRLPRYGEVGWYDEGRWQAVWKGTVERAAFTR
jgi:hypothetical protein